MQWFRFYSDSLDSLKVQQLPAPLFKVWVNLLCVANRSDERGCLPPLAEVAFALRMTEEEVGDAIRELSEREFFDATDGGFVAHNWSSRQPDSDTPEAAAERKRRQRKQQAKGEKNGRSHRGHSDSHGEVTAQSRVDTETETDTTTSLNAGAREIEDQASEIIRTANRGMALNPAIGDACNPIPVGHGSRQVVLDWLSEGIPTELAGAVVLQRAQEYQPGGTRRQITTMLYFDGAVRDAHSRAQATGPPGKVPALRIGPRAERPPSDTQTYKRKPYQGLNG